MDLMLISTLVGEFVLLEMTEAVKEMLRFTSGVSLRRVRAAYLTVLSHLVIVKLIIVEEAEEEDVPPPLGP